MKIAFLIIAFSIILSGCVPNIGLEKVDIIEGEYVRGKVVGGFPNLPRYPEAEIIESYSDDNNYGVSFKANDDLEKVVSFYGPALESFGWEYTLNQKSTTNYVFDFKNANFQGQIIVNTAGDGRTTAISAFAEPR